MILLELVLFIGKLVFYFMLFMLTFLFIVLYKKKSKNLSLKEKINYNISIIMSIQSLGIGTYALVVPDWDQRIIDFNYALMSSLVRTICSFYLYMYSLSLQVVHDNKFLCYAFPIWIVSFAISIFYYVKKELFFLAQKFKRIVKLYVFMT